MKKYILLCITAFANILIVTSCGCKCNCVKGTTCTTLSVYSIAGDSTVYRKMYCKKYDIYDLTVDDTISALKQKYPSDKYAFTRKDTTIIVDRITTKKCTGNPVDYFCDCVK